NFIQAQDFNNRKTTMKKGEPMKKWVAQIADFLATKKDPAFADEFAMMDDAFSAYNEILSTKEAWRASNPQLVQLFATRMLHAASMMICGKLMLDQALLAAKKLAELGE
ncbi:MAG TPA: acyl-CoA dehydrogenase, partial [Syntrophomonas wolfei]|nr:acyl-CoA dehydrogenase [Syntrophomonas wolfei]